MLNGEITTLKNYRDAVIERARISEQIERFGTIGAPSLLHGLQMDGMPRGTNDRASAERQRIEYMEDQLRTLNAQIEDMQKVVSRAIARIHDVREYFIVDSYYLKGKSDEWIATMAQCSTKTVYRRRIHALEKW